MSTSTRPERRRPWLLASAMAAAFLSVATVPAPYSRGDEIVIRPNLTLKDKKVTGFDEDGVSLGQARPISWDEIVGGRVERDQERFDRLRTTLAEPLSRIKRALSDGDYAAALEPAEGLFPTFSGRHSASAFMVSQALMWSRLANHRPEDAVEPYLVCVTLRQTPKNLVALPGRRQLRYDSRTGLSPELPLVGYDRARAAAALPAVRARLRKLGDAAPPGLRLYAAGLALAAGDAAGVDADLAAMASPPRPLAEIAEALRAQAGLARGRAAEAFSSLERLRAGCLDTNRALIGYLLGTARLTRGEGDPRDGVLDLLDVAASHAGEQPVLAAAALFAAQKALHDQHDEAGARALRVELLRSFPETDHGVRLLAELGPDSDEVRLAAQPAAGRPDGQDARAGISPDAGGPGPGGMHPKAGPARKRLNPAKQKDHPR